MKVTQISVFLENKAGRLGELCALLGLNGVNIRALTIADSEDYGVLRMIVDDHEKAVMLLKGHDCVVNVTDTVAVEVADRPGGLAGILAALAEHDVVISFGAFHLFERVGDVAEHVHGTAVCAHQDDIPPLLTVITEWLKIDNSTAIVVSEKRTSFPQYGNHLIHTRVVQERGLAVESVVLKPQPS